MKRLDNEQLADWLSDNGFERDGPRVLPMLPVLNGVEGTLPDHSGALSALARKAVRLKPEPERFAIIVGGYFLSQLFDSIA